MEDHQQPSASAISRNNKSWLAARPSARAVRARAIHCGAVGESIKESQAGIIRSLAAAASKKRWISGFLVSVICLLYRLLVLLAVYYVLY